MSFDQLSANLCLMCSIHREQPSSWGVEVSSGQGSREVKTSWHLSDNPLVDHISFDSGEIPREAVSITCYFFVCKTHALHMVVAFWWLNETNRSSTPPFRWATGGLSEWREWEDRLLPYNGVLQPGQLHLAGQNQLLHSVHCKCSLILFRCDIRARLDLNLIWNQIYKTTDFTTISHWELKWFNKLVLGLSASSHRAYVTDYVTYIQGVTCPISCERFSHASTHARKSRCGV